MKKAVPLISNPENDVPDFDFADDGDDVNDGDVGYDGDDGVGNDVFVEQKIKPVLVPQYILEASKSINDEKALVLGNPMPYAMINRSEIDDDPN